MSFELGQVGLKNASSLTAGGYSSELVGYDAVALEGGEYKSHEAKRLCKVIRERLRCLDTLNGTCYADNFDESVCSGDDEQDVARRRKLIESVAVPMCGGSMDQPIKSCLKKLSGGSPRPSRNVRFAAGHSVIDFDESEPVVSKHATNFRGVRAENMSSLLSGGNSNCRSDPSYAWTPGAPGPDGMGYCPDDFEPEL